jgi:uncharacterized membrane protein YvlD (DUF360 family)
VVCLTLIAQSRLAAAILLFLFASAVVFIADHFVRPALIGMSTRLPFLWILLGIFGVVQHGACATVEQPVMPVRTGFHRCLRVALHQSHVL